MSEKKAWTTANALLEAGVLVRADNKITKFTPVFRVSCLCSCCSRTTPDILCFEQTGKFRYVVRECNIEQMVGDSRLIRVYPH